MRTFLLLLLVLGLTAPGVFAGQSTWTPGSAPPSLILALGDGAVRKSFPLPSGAGQLDLTLRLAMADDPDLVLTWTSDGQLWSRQAKKMPGDAVPLRVDLPPGRLVTLEINTRSGTPLAVIKLPRK